MKRREFLKSTAAVTGGSLLINLGINRVLGEAQTEDTKPGKKPNILFILVDELRYPSVFPRGVHNVDEFFCRFMPKLHRHIWKPGVKFGNYRGRRALCAFPIPGGPFIIIERFSPKSAST
jgi:hypothetical protein